MKIKQCNTRLARMCESLVEFCWVVKKKWMSDTDDAAEDSSNP